MRKWWNWKFLKKVAKSDSNMTTDTYTNPEGVNKKMK